jgi:hypothetical protein
MAAVLALAACGAKATLPTSLEPEKPIAAHVFAAPADYVGKRIEIYGLVVETRRGGREFLLQDVSQMPLKVVRSDGMPTFPGDQVLVEGTVFLEGGRPTLAASRVRDTRVLGGGGCC